MRSPKKKTPAKMASKAADVRDTRKRTHTHTHTQSTKLTQMHACTRLLTVRLAKAASHSSALPDSSSSESDYAPPVETRLAKYTTLVLFNARVFAAELSKRGAESREHHKKMVRACCLCVCVCFVCECVSLGVCLCVVGLCMNVCCV